LDQLNTQTDYEFGEFRLDTLLQRLVTGSGESIALPARAYDTLRCLVDRAGELVDKNSLMQAVWPNTIVEESNLNQCIVVLRRALGETAGERRFILTVPGRGFKFVAPVRVTIAPRATPQSTEPPVSEDREVSAIAVKADPGTRENQSLFRYLTLASTLLAVLLAVGAVIWYFSHAEPVTSTSEYQPLTDVADTATSPVVSPDGRLLAYVRGGGFLGAGQIWEKLLPDGESVQLTDIPVPVFAPTFTPDGAGIAFTVMYEHGPNQSWETWTVPVTGGQPARLLPNASGLTYIGPHELMFSEGGAGIHMGIVTTAEDRSGHRDIYWPVHERGMAHLSYLSPDRRSVLVVEMDGTGSFQRCRLVPFAGGSAGVPVGPPGSCLSATWSRDGAWMYLAVRSSGHSHLWRQRYPDGEPQRITFGPTDEEAVFMAPDGHSLLTSVGTEISTLWLHTAAGERLLTTENNALFPWLSADAQRVYFLSAKGSAAHPALSRMDLLTGKREVLLPGLDVSSYDVDPAEQQVVFTPFRNGVSQVWLAPLDRHAPPKLLVSGADQPHFGGGMVFFRALGKRANYLHRINLDGSGDTTVLPSPIVNLDGVSPDARYVSVFEPQEGHFASAVIAVADRRQQLIGEGFFPAHWSRDGKALYVEMGPDGHSSQVARTALLPTISGAPQAGDTAQLLLQAEVFTHPDGPISMAHDSSVYVYSRYEQRRNIYRIPLH
jgi:eukaryotic-like serine/threonine-protein kinase